MPIGVAIKEGADVIITMGFESPYQTRISSVMRFAFQLSSITSNNLLKANYAFHNLAHHHEILPIIPQFQHKIHLFDTDKIPYVIEEGERAAEKQLPYLRQLLAPRERVTAPPGRLLVVDDTEVNRDLLARRLRALGHEVHDGGQRARGPRGPRRARDRPGAPRHHDAGDGRLPGPRADAPGPAALRTSRSS